MKRIKKIGLILLPIIGCKTRTLNESNNFTSGGTETRNVIETNKLPTCDAYGIEIKPSVAYVTPNGPNPPWALSDTYVTSYLRGNVFFPQSPIAIKLYLADHMLRDP